MAELPGGTVTFLLTDVEGSTAAWEQAPDAMRSALARHDALFDQAVAEHRGDHIRPRGEGDSRFAVFAAASNAVAAALAIQRALAAEPWTTPHPIRVRIGIHTGEAELREGDYYGSAVNRCARLRGIGHGGQVLLSEATAVLARDVLRDGATLVDLGEHRLKDLTRPERVFQLVAPDLPSDFPALMSLDAQAHNLPVQPTPLIGREREIQAARALLLRDDVRVLTLTGPGGTGKTRLGLQLAAELVDSFEDGVFLVTLAPVSDPALVMLTIADTLGVREAPGMTRTQAVAAALRRKRRLLVLDNFEQVVEAAPEVAELLAACPHLKLLVTSRAVLRITGEHELAVPPLALPVIPPLPTVDQLSQYEAVRLFIDRARSVSPNFTVTNDSAPAVAEICTRLDGLPLAVELAAARIRLLAPRALLARMEQRLPLLTGGGRDRPARQQTLRAAIAWSYDLLTPGEQRLFRRLGVFVAGWTLEAAEHVCAASGDLPIDVLDGLETLTANSLIRYEQTASGETRFGMLETIREYAVERLEESGEADALRQAHAAYFLEHAEALSHEIDIVRRFDQLQSEHDNLRAAMATLLRSSDDAEVARLAAALGGYWWHRGSLTEGERFMTEALARAEAYPAQRATLLYWIGRVRLRNGDFQQAIGSYQQSLGLFQELGDRAGIAVVLLALGTVLLFGPQPEQGRGLLEQSIALGRAVGVREGPVLAYGLLGMHAYLGGDLDRATDLATAGIVVADDVEDLHGRFTCLTVLGQVAMDRGSLRESFAIMCEGLLAAQAFRDPWDVAHGLLSLAVLATESGEPARAACLFASSITLLERIGSEVFAPYKRLYESCIARIKSEIGDEEFDAAWVAGASMTEAQWIAYALETEGS